MVVKIGNVELRMSRAVFVYKVLLICFVVSLPAFAGAASVYSYASARIHDAHLFHAAP